MFQFQYGAIGSFNQRTLSGLSLSFNSSMVRLVDSGVGLSIVDVPCFNSSMVRLVAVQLGDINNWREVSIPVWCDW